MQDLIKRIVSPKTKKIAFYTAQKLLHPLPKKSKKVLITFPELAREQINEVKLRCAFYLPEYSVEVLEIDPEKPLPATIAFATYPILVLGHKTLKPTWMYRHRGGIFNIDYLCNHEEGTEWHKVINYVSQPSSDYLIESKNRFSKYVEELQKNSLNKCYIFGTGPSLEKAIDLDWSDGYRVVCNTIVRDPDLWKHLNPHFIVAGDTIYHFGFTSFAKAFRKDLAKRLSETQTMFIYPALFHNLVAREFKQFSDRLIPIPMSGHTNIYVDLTQKFELPNLGNILALLLFPVACTLSKDVNLFGFDGRAPDDQLFWKNSTKHTYSELMEELQKAHPHFFEYHVPKHDTQKYVKSVHGDLLDQKMTEAERKGWKFTMLHKSWTSTLQKRYIQ